MLSKPWKVREEVVLVVGAQDPGVANINILHDVIRPFVPQSVQIRKHILDDCSHSICRESSIVNEDIIQRMRLENVHIHSLLCRAKVVQSQANLLISESFCLLKVTEDCDYK